MRVSREYLEIVASGLSQETGVKINAGKSWHYNTKTRELCYNPDDLLRLPPDVIKGLLLHETAHTLFTDASHQPTAQRQEVLNVLEDRRIEIRLENRLGEFASYYLDDLNNYFLNLWEKTPPEDFQKQSRLKQGLLVASAYGCDLQGTAIILRDKLSPEIMADQKQRHAIQCLGDMVNSARYSSTTGELEKEIEKRLAEIKPLFDPDEGGKGKGGKGGDKSEDVTGSGSSTGSGKTGTRRTYHRHKYQAEDYQEIKMLLKPEIETLSRKLLAILRENTTPRLYGQFRHGILDASRAVNVAIGDPVPFKRRGDYQRHSYNFRIALDASGSMDGKKAKGAYYASAIVLETARRLKCDCRVYSFGCDTNLLATDRTASKLGNYRANEGSTRDAEALEVIARDVKPGDKSLVFIIGDGDGDGSRQLAPHLEKLRKQGAQVFGIGIGTTSIPYPNATHTSDPEKLAGILATKIKQVIKRRTL